MRTINRRTPEQKQDLINKYEALRAEGVKADAAAKSLGFNRKDIYQWRINLKDTPAKVVTYAGNTLPKAVTALGRKPRNVTQLALVIGSPEQLTSFLRGMNV